MTPLAASSFCGYAQPVVHSIVLLGELKLATWQTRMRASGPVPIINALRCETKTQPPPFTWALRRIYVQYIPNRARERQWCLRPPESRRGMKSREGCADRKWGSSWGFRQQHPETLRRGLRTSGDDWHYRRNREQDSSWEQAGLARRLRGYRYWTL